ncbi:relaxase/mobilization nuclease domain-containing protein [Butyrivibrio sp. INlla16]|uniref:relaxase/mobilization nuclease domain-containing protein n=1 Tax=Butyrivibrio sp. INlla16 TaxID=1520807 RepID=UPI0008805FC8|nr:relaxase/mobilization nuclease domain-containing protein [Butyrivibrio sp. INlla16]SDB50285.1 Relaxase/Mobilisation nuclease domain-containing protein [Butyrivibrio sp. INlla16]
MAITKIHPIKTAPGRSIKYITNPAKTEEGILVSAYACSVETAAFDFDSTFRKATQHESANKAFHLIQSFAPGEVTPGQAHDIGIELADQILQNRFSYVIATHTDKGHVHNHIVFCSVDNFTHKKYLDNKESYKKIRTVNDRICEAHGLSTIKNPDRAKETWKEHNEAGRGTSWKQQMRIDINEAIRTSLTYTQFLSKVHEMGYETKGEYDLKYIAFRKDGMERWVRGSERSLGKDFTRERIQKRIAEQIELKAQKRTDRIKKTIEEPAQFIDTSQERFADKPGLKRWADKQNLKSEFQSYRILQEHGYASLDDLAADVKRIHKDKVTLQEDIAALEHEIKELSQTIKYLNQYYDNKPYHDKLRRNKNKRLIQTKYDTELTLYTGARNMLQRLGINPQYTNLNELDTQLQNMHNQRDSMLQQYHQAGDKEVTLQKLQKMATEHLQDIAVQKEEKRML